MAFVVLAMLVGRQPVLLVRSLSVTRLVCPIQEGCARRYNHHRSYHISYIGPSPAHGAITVWVKNPPAMMWMYVD